MLSAGLLYKKATLQRKGIAMMFSRSFAVHGGFAPLGRIQGRMQTLYSIWALEHVVCDTSPSGDLRWMIATMVLKALAAFERLIQRQLVRLARNTMGRALQGARFASLLRTADSMV